MKRIIQNGSSVDGEDGEAVERENGSDGFVEGLPDSSEVLEVVEDDQLTASGSVEPRGNDTAEDGFSTAKPSEPTKSDVLGFIRETKDVEEGNIYLPGESWSDRPIARYVEIELVQGSGRLTRPGACILCYASKMMAEASSPQTELIAMLNAEGVTGFARRAFEIDPEEAKVEEGLDELLS